MNGKVKAYCRVSTDLQSDGVSLEVQETRIAAYCIAQGLTLEKVYKDICSGKDTNREQFQKMLTELVRGDTVAVLDLSRLSRSTIDTLTLIREFEKLEIGNIRLTQTLDRENAEGKLMITFMSGLNEFERANTARKVSATMQTLSKQGKLRGRPPFGWKFVGEDRDFEPEPEQQAVLEKIKQMQREGKKLKQIADALNQRRENKCMMQTKKNSK